jgi:hypothetical protein
MLDNSNPAPADYAAGRFKTPVDKYSWRIIFTRWLLLAIEFGIAVYIILGVRQELAIMYVVYAVVCLFLLLPLIRCVRCSYYGKRCNIGWGVWVSKLFPRDEKSPQSAYYGYTILFWPLRIFPILFGLRFFIDGIVFVFSGAFDEFLFIPHGLYLTYIGVIIIHRRFYRASSCARCHERLSCPVYNSRAMLTHARAGAPRANS